MAGDEAREQGKGQVCAGFYSIANGGEQKG